MTSHLRPDEAAANAQIEKAGTRDRYVKGALKTGAAIGMGALSSRIAPFLSSYVPMDLAIKGISKISPELGKFLSRGLSMGLDAQEGLNFIKENMGPKEEKKQESAAKENRNIIEQYSPELHQFIDQEIKSGRPAMHAGALAQNDRRFSNVIKKMVKDHKTPWSNILQSVYGQQGQPQGQAASAEQQAPNQSQQQPTTQGIDPQLAQLMNGIRQSIQKLKGSP